jgi:antitoxin VapB
MPLSSLFKSNRTQAVRLPKAVAFPDDVKQVEIVKIGNSRIISPVGRRWDSFFADASLAIGDFERPEQPPVQEREPL